MSSPATALPLPAAPAEARWWLDPAWPVFAGHFPGSPVLPGACLLDWAVAALSAHHAPQSVAWHCAWAKFPRAALPGDLLRLRWSASAKGWGFTIERLGQAAGPLAEPAQPQAADTVASGLLVQAQAA